MAPRSSPKGQAPEVEMACTLMKKFFKDHDLTATTTAFKIDLKRKGWTTRKNTALAKAGLSSLEKLLANQNQQKSRGSDDDANISDSSSLTSVPENELGSDFPEEDQVQCHWMKCTKQFLSAQKLLKHVCDDHIGKRRSENYALSCGWQGCGYDAASKRNHLVSHVQTHIKLYKPHRCNDCGADFARVQDKNTHLATRKHQQRVAEAKASNGLSATLKRKATEDVPEQTPSHKPAKRTKVKQNPQLDGAYSSLSSASSSTESSDSSDSSDSMSLASSLSSSSSSSSSSSDSGSEVLVRKGQKHQINAAKKVSNSNTSSSSSDDSSSSEDSSDSDSDESTSSSDESESDVSISSSGQVIASTLPKQDDQAASNSSDTVQGDKKTSPDRNSREDTPQDRLLTKTIANMKKHVGARQTPLAQLSAQATPDSHISNAYISYDYAERAYNDLSITRGKGFTKEKNKKKRGSYRGGAIDISGGKSFKFDD